MVKRKNVSILWHRPKMDVTHCSIIHYLALCDCESIIFNIWQPLEQKDWENQASARGNISREGVSLDIRQTDWLQEIYGKYKVWLTRNLEDHRLNYWKAAVSGIINDLEVISTSTDKAKLIESIIAYRSTLHYKVHPRHRSSPLFAHEKSQDWHKESRHCSREKYSSFTTTGILAWKEYQPVFNNNVFFGSV